MMRLSRTQCSFHRSLYWCLFVLMVVALASLGTPRPALADSPTTVFAVLHPNPGIMVGRGDILTYEIRVMNDGNDDAAYVRAVVSYESEHLTLDGSRFDKPTDWVSDVTSADATREQVTLTFVDVNPDEVRSGYVMMKVNDTLPDWTVIDTFMAFDWTDAGGNRSLRQANSAPVLVASGPVHSEFAWMEVRPVSAPQGTTQQFFSNRFLPDEKVVFWLNLPDGTPGAINREARVDEDGMFTLDFPNGDLPPGDYQMVAYGMNSKLTGFADFTVTP
jgi:hypothetical protein